MMGNEIDNDPELAHNETHQLKFSTSGHMTSNDVILTSFRRGDVASTSYDVVSTSYDVVSTSCARWALIFVLVFMPPFFYEHHRLKSYLSTF